MASVTDKNVSVDTLLKVGGFIAVFVGQAFAIYTSLEGKISDLNNRIVEIEKVLIERSKYVEVADDLTQRVKDLEQQIVEMSYQDLNNFKKINEVDTTLRRHIEIDTPGLGSKEEN